MAGAMKRAAETGVELTAGERNSLNYAFKSILDVRRSAWLLASSQKEEDYHPNVLRTFKTKIEEELSTICNDVVKLMEVLIEKSSNEESKIFYKTMKADYHRYHAEIKIGAECKDEAEKARKAYEEALESSKKTMKAASTTRLAIVIKLSVLYSDVLNLPDKAYELSNKAAEEADAESKNGEGDKQMLELLKSNRQLFKKYKEQANG